MINTPVYTRPPIGLMKEGESRNFVVPFSHETLPPAFHFLLIQIIDIDLLLYVQVEGEHRLIGREVTAGYLVGSEWKWLWFD